jgi:glutamate dehydrogenase
MIVRLPGDKHWQMLARNAMQDDLSGLQRTIAGEILAQDGTAAARDELLAAWRERNRRPIERVQHLLAELRSAPTADSAMLAVALRELRNLG